MGSVRDISPNMSERYVLKQARTRSEMDGIMDVIWAANYTPYEPFAQLFFPVLGFTQAHRDASVLESKERFWVQHQSDISSNWYFVMDSETGRPVGCAQWQIHRTNPFSKGTPKLTAPWWPEKEHRRFAESILNQVYMPRASWMRRPHLALNWMAVIPTHRSRGIGAMLMAAGINRADELRLECWLEASSMGKPLYERFGFRSLMKIGFDTERRDASDIWRKCEHELTPHPLFVMWRPKGGNWEGGENASRREVKMPWDLGVE